MAGQDINFDSNLLVMINISLLNSIYPILHYYKFWINNLMSTLIYFLSQLKMSLYPVTIRLRDHIWFQIIFKFYDFLFKKTSFWLSLQYLFSNKTFYSLVLHQICFNMFYHNFETEFESKFCWDKSSY